MASYYISTISLCQGLLLCCQLLLLCCARVKGLNVWNLTHITFLNSRITFFIISVSIHEAVPLYAEDILEYMFFCSVKISDQTKHLTVLYKASTLAKVAAKFFFLISLSSVMTLGERANGGGVCFAENIFSYTLKNRSVKYCSKDKKMSKVYKPYRTTAVTPQTRLSYVLVYKAHINSRRFLIYKSCPNEMSLFIRLQVNVQVSPFWK